MHWATWGDSFRSRSFFFFGVLPRSGIRGRFCHQPFTACSRSALYAPDTSGVFVSLCHHSVGVICVLYLPYSGNFESLNSYACPYSYQVHKSSFLPEWVSILRLFRDLNLCFEVGLLRTGSIWNNKVTYFIYDLVTFTLGICTCRFNLKRQKLKVS